MGKLAPLTKLILTIAVSVWAMLLQSPAALALLAGAQLAVIGLARVSNSALKAVGSICLFGALLAGLQYLLGSGTVLAAVTGLRMVAMTLVFVILLATTRIQDLTAALVSQCRIPYEYAFMFTAALRFIPDFLAESKAVQEAQACRGYSPRGNPLRRLVAYIAVVEPLVLRAIHRSETMAMSLELRGFGSRQRTFSGKIALTGRDYAAFAGMLAVTTGIVAARALGQ